MKIRRSPGDKVFDFVNVIFMCCLMVITVYPVVYVLFASVSDPMKIMTHRGLLLAPKGFSLEAYASVLENQNILHGYKNTLFILFAGTTINVFLTSLGAYALSRKNFLPRDFLMKGIVFTMLFSGGLIPTYLLVRDLKMIDSLWALIMTTAISTYNLIIMRTSFQQIPDSLIESAKIDGANDFFILFKIVLPLSGAVLAVMILFYGVDHWNAWFRAAIYLRTRMNYPLQLVLREILIQNSTQSMMAGGQVDQLYFVGETIKYATIIVSTLPILFIYPFMQKYFIKGVMIGAIKG